MGGRDPLGTNHSRLKRGNPIRCSALAKGALSASRQTLRAMPVELSSSTARPRDPGLLQVRVDDPQSSSRARAVRWMGRPRAATLPCS